MMSCSHNQQQQSNMSNFYGFTSTTGHLLESELEVKVSASVDETDVISQLSGKLNSLHAVLL